ncbi:hypothetical protein C9374_002267 [Naegleria lovaniensis]|uniref:Uncharacterized protein n=1 Tax=Naegleria lovaniensis TaxID=51637 RepID=A0AA88GUG4_NAELO|nr:uncharacterized protein C9374_002267 [Naegleria lovaniensis]KAG2386523.1 hypothetical protein C9374_002267 [Naegleria lovaniensis]
MIYMMSAQPSNIENISLHPIIDLQIITTNSPIHHQQNSHYDLQEYNELFQKFKLHMRSPTRKAFSLKFELVHELVDFTDDERPVDVRVSTSVNCIIIITMMNRIRFVDLVTKKFIGRFDLSSLPNCLEIEKNYNGMNDALLLSCENGMVLKYDLARLFKWSLVNENCEECDHCKPIWCCEGFGYPFGIAIREEFAENLHALQRRIYVCDYTGKRIDVLNAVTGERILRIDENLLGSPIDRPSGIIFNHLQEMIVTDYENFIHVIKKNSKDEYQCSILSLPFTTKSPLGITFDRMSNHVLVADQFQHCIYVINENKEFVKRFGDDTLFNEPFSLCIDETTGELYVTVYAMYKIMIYR